MVTQIQGMDTEYKPWGLTAGAMVGERQADMEAANLLALQESQLANVLKQRDAMEAQGQMQNPDWLKWKLAGQMGEGMSKRATGEYDQGVLKDKLATSIAEFGAKRGTHELDKIGNTLDLILSTYNNNGPLGLKSLQGKIPDQLYQYIGSNPNAITELTKMSDRLKTTRADTPTQRNAMQLEGFKQEGTYITEDMKQQEANKRQKMEVDAKYADISQRREEAKARKTEANESKLEQAITGRINSYRSILVEIGKRRDALDEAESMPSPGTTKEQRAARKEALAKARRELDAEEMKIKQQIIALNDQSSLGAVDGGSSTPKPTADVAGAKTWDPVSKTWK